MKNKILIRNFFFNWAILIFISIQFLASCENTTLFNESLDENLITPRSNFSKTCYGNFSIRDKKDLNLLVNQNCTAITGDLTITRSLLRNLSGLERLNSINGDIQIKNNTTIKNLSGLDNLNHIGGDLIIYNNPSLVSIHNIGNLKTLRGDLHIKKNIELATCNVYNFKFHLVENGWNGDFFENNNNNNGTCENICYGTYTIKNESDLEKITNCDVITGSLNILKTSIRNLNTASNLKSVKGDLIIYDNPNLENFSGLRGLEKIEGTFAIIHTPGIANMEDFNNLTTIFGEIVQNDEIPNLFRNGKKSLVLRNNDNLANLSGLKNLKIKDGDVIITNNSNLPTCEARNLVRNLKKNNFNGKDIIKNNNDGGTCGNICSVNINASPSTVNPGQGSILTWTALNDITVFIDNDIGYVKNNSIPVSPSVTTTYTITATCSQGTATDSITVTVNSGPEQTEPVAHWTLEEGNGNNITDLSGNGHNGTFVGNPEWIEGVVGNYALDINEHSGYVEVANQNDFHQQRFTISAWLTSANGLAVAAYMRLPDSWQMITENNEWKFVYYNSTGNMTRVEPGYFFPATEEWHHYAITVDTHAGEVHFYVDGVELQGLYQATTINTPSANQPLLIGQFANDYRWNGSIDDIRFYDTVLNSNEIYNISQNINVVTLDPGINEMTIEHNGQTRNYAIHVPQNYNPHQSYPVVLCLHPRYADRNYFYSSMGEIVNSENIIGVYPQGINNSWNTGYGYEPSNADDVEFIEMVVNQVRSLTNVNTNRIFAMGVSNGGGMCYRLALNTNIFAGITSIMYSMYENQSIPSSTMPLSVLQINGSNDSSVPFGGGYGNMGVPFESAESSVRLWGIHNNGVSNPQMNYQPGFVVYDFSGQNEVLLYNLYNQPHAVPATIAGVETYRFIWQFFNRNGR